MLQHSDVHTNYTHYLKIGHEAEYTLLHVSPRMKHLILREALDRGNHKFFVAFKGGNSRI